MLKLANTVLILINTGPSNVKKSIKAGQKSSKTYTVSAAAAVAGGLTAFEDVIKRTLVNTGIKASNILNAVTGNLTCAFYTNLHWGYLMKLFELLSVHTIVIANSNTFSH